jgi:hypothetical protein
MFQSLFLQFSTTQLPHPLEQAYRRRGSDIQRFRTTRHRDMHGFMRQCGQRR